MVNRSPEVHASGLFCSAAVLCRGDACVARRRGWYDSGEAWLRPYHMASVSGSGYVGATHASPCSEQWHAPYGSLGMMEFAARGNRRSIRLRGYNYSLPGAYFVTVCAYRKQMLFGEIISGQMRMSHVGRVVETRWLSLPDHFDYVTLDEFVIMPNHFHAIAMVLGDDIDRTIDGSDRYVDDVVGARHASPGDDACVVPTGPRPRSLAALIGSFKSAVTKQVHEAGYGLGSPVWQRNYYEHIVRDEASLNRIREYISANPVRWEFDRENPERKTVDEFDVWLGGFKERPRPE